MVQAKKIFLFLTGVLSFSFLNAQNLNGYSQSEILLQFNKLQATGSVLYIAAHPDDENTRLLSYLANEKCLRTAYLSLTRGDGGQNLIGSEQGTELGVIRTQELLAARRTDGAEQFFSRAYDFGYSKTPKETFEKWTHQEILSDVVYVIRKFRPDIIITRFATDGSGGHGHHTASAILAEEAFEAAADPTKFPEQLNRVAVWQAKRLFYNNASKFWNPNADMSGNLKMDVGGYNTLLGKNYGEIAAESRSMHRSQGFGSAKQRGEMFEYFKPLKGDTANLQSIFDRLDFTWNNKTNGKQIAKCIALALENYKKGEHIKCNTQLLAAMELFPAAERIQENYWYGKLLKTCLLLNGIYLEALAEGSAYAAIGDSLKIKITGLNRSNTPLILENIKLFAYGQGNACAQQNLNFNIAPTVLNYNIPFTTSLSKTICKETENTKMYWLKNSISDNKFWIEKEQIGLGYALQSGYKVSFDLNIQGKNITWTEELQYKYTDPEKGERYRPLIITDPAFINITTSSLIVADSNAKEIKVSVKAGRDKVKGLLLGSTTWDWTISVKGDNKKEWYTMASTYIELDKKGDEKEIIFLVKGPAQTSIGNASFKLIDQPKPAEEKENEIVELTKERNDYSVYPNYSCGLQEIKYDHIPTQVLFPEAKLKLVKVAVKHQLKKIAYISGAGDDVEPCLAQLGYQVTLLTNEKLASENLQQYEAIITGVRAYNTNEYLSAAKSKLMDYVKKGGNLIVQYNTNSFAGPFKGDIGPYPFKITRDRITDEKAVVTIELPNHPVFNKPNKITQADFEDWIQERSIYHAGETDAHYELPISMNDPGEKPNKGALAICKYGEGYFVYTGLVFFRELPAGVPGAYRLMVNLIELGK